MSRLSDFLFGLEGGSGIGGMPIQIVSSDTLLSPNYSYGIDTSQGGVEVTLPASPIPGDRISFFDAALTWNKNPARIHVNGNQVEQETVALTSYLLNKKAGIQELLFIGVEVGWKDVSLYRTGVNPMWYGSTLEGIYKAIDVSTQDIVRTMLHDGSTSGDFTVPFSGYYCILATGGSASAYKETAPPGDTIVSVGGDEVFRSKGAKFAQGSNPPHDSFAEINREYRIPYTFDANPQKIAFAVLDAGTSSEKIDEGNVFGISGFTVSGGRHDRTDGVFRGTPKKSSSVVLYLQEGAEIVFSVGVGGKGSGNGNSGRVQIYSLEGINVL